uniref:Uncharacterized protein n=1 Tax=Branchiostoma floridae TaxID=7739 RepID=C3YE86_BRAFL|eukprot:XP_002605384.1 hypothetical protein BRAFLDRAFT_74204 [Branchiostoma floridae]
MKFYTFNGAALALMERSLRDGTDPDEDIVGVSTNVKKFGITRVVPSSTQNTDSQTTNRKTTTQPDKQAKHRKKIKQTHKRIVLPGEHHGKFKRARCDNCGTSNYVCVSGKATEASTTCKNCDEEVTWVN